MSWHTDIAAELQTRPMTALDLLADESGWTLSHHIDGFYFCFVKLTGYVLCDEPRYPAIAMGHGTTTLEAAQNALAHRLAMLANPPDWIVEVRHATANG